MSAEWIEVQPPRAPHLRVLTASSSAIKLDDKIEAQRQRQLRQNWQLQSWTYRDSVPELRYALNFLANCASRMRVFVAAYKTDGPTEIPVDIHDPEIGGLDADGNGIPAPPELIVAVENAMRALGNGTLALGPVMHSLSTNLSTTGEAFLLGMTDPLTLKITWSIRSISEIVVYNDVVMLREGPMTSNGMLGLTPLPPGTLVERMWKPHPQFRILADCAMRALVNTCEDILIQRRAIRAVGRSRISGRGILFLPSEIDIPSLNNDDDSSTSDDFIAEFTDSILIPIRNEGDSSGAVPLVIEASGDAIAKIRHMTFESEFDKEGINVRAELIGNLATGLDLPAEIIKGMMDSNHWTAYQVSADTVRQHIEPHVIDELECLTGAFLRPYLLTCPGLSPALLDEWLDRLLFWYDPTELVTPPDLSAQAKTAHDMLILSDAATRKYMGFKDEDAPDAEEIELRMVRNTRNWPPNALIALLHDLDPDLTFPPITQSGMIPGLKAGIAGGVDVGVPGPGLGASAPSLDVTTPSTNDTGGLGEPPGPPVAIVGSFSPANLSASERLTTIAWARQELTRQTGYDPYATAVPVVAETVTMEYVNAKFAELLAALTPRALLAASTPPQPASESKRLSRQLGQINTDTLRRLQVQANAEIRRMLEKAGTRIRAKANKDSALRSKMGSARVDQIPMKLGQRNVESLGFSAASLMTTDWATFEEQFRSWVSLAQRRAVATAAQLAGIDEIEAHAAAAIAMSEGLDAGWNLLRESMDTIAVHALYNPDPNISEVDALASLNPDTIVPAGTIRAALGVAGGSPASDFKAMLLDTGAEVPALVNANAVGGIGLATGPTIAGILTNAGAQNTSYEWVHGPSPRPFDPHLALDGVEFTSFVDEVLANNTGFPDNAFFLPGDHAGCLCSADPQWVSADDLAAARESAGVEAL
jgi:hypothetical protein